jgi:hypothetical protein
MVMFRNSSWKVGLVVFVIEQLFCMSAGIGASMYLVSPTIGQ